MKRNFNYLILFVLLLLPVGVFAFSNPVVDPIISYFPLNTDNLKNADVLDGAKILSTKTEEYIIKKSDELEKEAGIKILVVTVSGLDDSNIEDFTNSFFNLWQISNNDENNNLLLMVLSLKEGKFNIKVGTGLTDVLTSSKIDEVKNKYISTYFKDDEWDNGIKNGYNAFYAEIVESRDLDIKYIKPVDANDNNSIETIILTIIFSLLIIVVAAICIYIEYFVKDKKKNKRKNINKTKKK
ncbi:MAG: TPM domain-containing protein [Firmicutes bacterium]|nr:TPM domain-containing protein [Bacillota bacterium]